MILSKIENHLKIIMFNYLKPMSTKLKELTETYQQKTEVKNMFNMEPNVSFVNGYKAPNDKLQQRYNFENYR